MKKILSLLLVALLVIGMFPIAPIHAHAATDEYELVTDASNLSVGDSVIIVAKDSAVALSTTQNKNNRGQAAITKSGNIATFTSAVQVLELAAGTTSGTFAFYTGSGYLYAASSSNNYLKTETKLSANSSWKITIANGVATIQAQGTNTRNVMQYNSSSSLFACYSGATQKAVAIYKLKANSCTHTWAAADCETPKTCTLCGETEGEALGHNYANGACTVCGAEDPSVCAHSSTSVVTTDATCMEAGATNIVCSDCGETISTEEIPALGHTKVVDAAVDATCIATGLTEGSHCSVCGEVIVAQEKVAMIDHAYENRVCTVCGVKQLNIQKATAIAVDDEVIIVSESDKAVVEMNGFKGSDYAYGEAYVSTPVGKNVWTVVAGASEGTYAFIKDGAYMAWSAGNSLKTSNTLDANSSWNVSFDENGNAIITNSADSTRKLQWNASSPRFACYTSKQTAIQLYIVRDWETPIDPVDPNPSEPTQPSEPVEPETPTTTETAPSEPTQPSEPVEPENPTTTEEESDEPVVVDKEFTITFDDTAKRTNLTTSQQVWEENGIVVTNNKGSSTTNVADYVKPARFYKNSELVIEYASMSKIVVYCNSNDSSYATNLKTSIKDDNATVSVEGNVATIVFNNAVDEFKVVLSASQLRVDSIVVTARVSSCDHQWSEMVETSAPTCTAVGVYTSTCTKCGEKKVETVPALGHNYTYADGKMTCTCGESFAINTIAEAKAYTDTATVYYIKGIVTYVSGQTIYIEDETGAICVYFTNAENAAGIALGDEILVWDTMTTYNKLIETTFTTSEEYMKISSGNELPVKTVTIADLKDDTTNEYLGERVVIENVTMGVINASGNTALTDADGNSINIYKVSGLSEAINVNDIVTVTAVVSTHNGYQLLVNPGTATADVVEIQHVPATVIETITIAEAKAGTAGEYYQVEGIVTMIDGRTVYIQDSTGGIVIYLTKEPGNTQIGDTIKAYGALKDYNGLIELEGIDPTVAAQYEVLASGATVEAAVVTLAQLNADTDKVYMATKVQVNNVFITSAKYDAKAGTVNYVLRLGDEEGSLTKVPAASEEDVLAAGTEISVEAVLYFNEEYRLRVVSAESITVIAAADQCAHGHTYVTGAAEATMTVEGYTGDTKCSYCGVVVIPGEVIPCLAAVDSWNLTLGSDLTANFRLHLDASVSETVGAVVTVNGKDYDAKITVAEDGYAYVAVELAAAQMTDKITVQFVNGEEAGAVKEYTIRGYADTILDGNYSDEAKALVKEMLNYGAAAQTYFGYNAEDPEKLANNNIEGAGAAEIAGESTMTAGGKLEGVNFHAASLVYRNKVALRIYFTAESIEGLTFAVDGVACEPVTKDNFYVVEIADILPQDLAMQYVITVTDGTDTITVNYSPMDYIIRMNAKGSKNLKALLKAMYNYYLAAAAYVAE